MNNLLKTSHQLGVLSLLAWIAIYAMPAFTPNHNEITQLGTGIRELLISQGIFLDNSSFNAGVLLTALGIFGQLTDMLKRK